VKRLLKEWGVITQNCKSTSQK
jgi:hypothetical protein